MSVDFPDTTQSTYDLAGQTLADVAAEIAAQDEAAKTEWFPHYDYTTTGDALATATVVVPTKITMPRRPSYSSAGDADRREWDRFQAALQAHEQGHVDLVTQNLTGIDDRLVGNTVADANRIWANALNLLQAASDAYDRDTDHGRNQGTIIQVSIQPDNSPAANDQDD
jgi:predicted secreted Zn-dependent protease